MVIVQVISSRTGNPIKGKRVSLGNNALFSSGVSSGQITNARGEAEFPTFTPCPSGEIYIDGKSVYKGRIQGLMRMYAD